MLAEVLHQYHYQNECSHTLFSVNRLFPSVTFRKIFLKSATGSDDIVYRRGEPISLYLKLFPIPIDSSDNIRPHFQSSVVMSGEKTLNTDGKTTYNSLKEDLTVINVKVDYTSKNHRLYWMNVIIGNIQNHITGIYHGGAKCDLPLFLEEQEYRLATETQGVKCWTRFMTIWLHPFLVPER